ncbi:MAG: hypothetical protein PVH29_04390 [Candidatus Zixiibacteriota bacterium]|jgi:hypothetical protein
MAQRIALGICIAALACAAWLGCNSSTGPSDDENVRGLIDGEYAAYFNDSEAYGGGKPGGDGYERPALGGDAAATLPVAWWRTVTYAKRDYWIHIEAPYTTADVIVKDDIQGLMYIDRTTNGTLDPGSKPVAIERTRYATFERATTDDPWALTAISPAVWALADAGRQTVAITSVRLVTAGGYDRTFTDMTEPIPLDELPHVTYGEEVTVTMKATNTSGEEWEPATFCFDHHDWKRGLMDDDGAGTYTGTYTITADPGVRHGGVSGIDAGTMQNESEDDYNADGWSLPFEVQ